MEEKREESGKGRTKEEREYDKERRYRKRGWINIDSGRKRHARPM